MSENIDRVEIISSSGVIQSPDGGIQYYTKSINNKNNPYLKQTVLQEVESETNSNYSEVVCNGEIIYILTNDLNRALKLESKACLVRILCFMDFLINLLASLTTYNILVANLIVSLISLSGYYSTYTYSKFGLILYLVYQYIQTIGKIILLSFYIAASVSTEFTEQISNNTIIYIVPAPSNIVILVFITLAQIYITYFIQSFYNLLPTSRPRPRFRH